MKKYILTTMLGTLNGDMKAYWTGEKLSMYSEDAYKFSDKELAKADIGNMYWVYSSSLEPTIEIVE